MISNALSPDQGTSRRQQDLVLVTGAHRSGTTWVGKVLSHSPQFGYLHEPFNLIEQPEIFGFKTDRFYYRVTPQDERSVTKAISRMIRFRPSLFFALSSARNIGDIRRIVRNVKLLRSYRLDKRIPLIKDPMALFSADWIGRNFRSCVIVTVRHPAAFVQSLRRLNWEFPFHHLLQQPELMDDLLFPYRDVIVRLSNAHASVEDQAAYLWTLIYGMVARIQSSQPGWLVTKIEDIANSPVHRFHDIVAFTGAEFDRYIRDAAISTSSANNPVTPTANRLDVNRNSGMATVQWKKDLSHDAVDRIRRITGLVSDVYYTSDDW